MRVFAVLSFAALLALASPSIADSIGPCDAEGAPAVGIVRLGDDPARGVWYVDDRNIAFGNGIWVYQESNGVFTGGVEGRVEPLLDLQRGGSSAHTWDEDLCTDLGDWDPDTLIL